MIMENINIQNFYYSNVECCKSIYGFEFIKMFKINMLNILYINYILLYFGK